MADYFAVRAALLFGNTLHTANQPFNYENGSGGNGLFPRSGDRLAGLNKFASVLRDYCVASDPICAGGDIVANHLNYFDIYSTNAADWVVEKLGLEDGPTSTVMSTTSSTVRSSTDISSSSSTSEASSAYASATSFSGTASQMEETTASETYDSTASETQGTTEQTTQPASSDAQDNAPDASSDGSSLVSLSSISMRLILGFVIFTFTW